MFSSSLRPIGSLRLRVLFGCQKRAETCRVGESSPLGKFSLQRRPALKKRQLFVSSDSRGLLLELTDFGFVVAPAVAASQKSPIERNSSRLASQHTPSHPSLSPFVLSPPPNFFFVVEIWDQHLWLLPLRQLLDSHLWIPPSSLPRRLHLHLLLLLLFLTRTRPITRSLRLLPRLLPRRLLLPTRTPIQEMCSIKSSLQRARQALLPRREGTREESCSRE